jgi:hypothetical protein
MLGADLIRPSLAWLSVAAFGAGSLARTMAAMRDPAGFAELRARCSADPKVAQAALTRNLYRAAALVSAKGGTIRDITPGDVLDGLDAEAAARGTNVGSTGLFYRLLHEMGSLGPDAPATEVYIVTYPASAQRFVFLADCLFNARAWNMREPFGEAIDHLVDGFQFVVHIHVPSFPPAAPPGQ